MKGGKEQTQIRDAQTALMACYRQLRSLGRSHNDAVFQTKTDAGGLDPEVAQKALNWFTSWARSRGLPRDFFAAKASRPARADALCRHSEGPEGRSSGVG